MGECNNFITQYTAMTISKTSLTPFKPGSLRELMFIAIPLIVVSLSENLMILFDRVILSHYSLAALNASSIASQAVEIFQYALLAISGMSEILVAKLYANKDKANLAIPTWQMLYLSLLTLPLIVFLSIYSGQYILPAAYLKLGLPYYNTLLFSVPLLGGIVALSGFFIGQGKTKLVLFSSIAINIINLLLDFILIFGVRGLCPALGPKGAALSAVIALFIQFVWLLRAFLNRSNRTQYQTHRPRFHAKYFNTCLKVGVPIASGHAIELIGWFLIFKVVANTNIINVTLMSLGSSLYLIFALFNDGFYRSLCATFSYHVGANNPQALQKTLQTGIGVFLLFMTLLAIPMLVSPNYLITLFNLKLSASGWHDSIKISLLFMWLYFLSFGFYWVISAILTAHHRTVFITLSNVSCFYLFTLAPIFILTKQSSLAPDVLWPLFFLGSSISGLVCFGYFRYRLRHL